MEEPDNPHSVTDTLPLGPARSQVVGLFASQDEADRAIEQLGAAGVESSVVESPSPVTSGARLGPSANVAGGAGVGAVLGGMLGAVAGWLAGSSGALTIPPGIGTIVGQDVFTTMLTGLGVGAAIGAVLGGLVGLSSPQPDVAAIEESPGETVEVTAHPWNGHEEHAAEIMRANGAYEVRMLGSSAVSPHAPRVIPETSAEEDLSMADEPIEQAQPDESQQGSDPNSITGTRGAIDPETGAYGTAGTPVTTGYGVSGSTVGVGSEQGEERHEDRDFAGATPDTLAYETGGRDSEDRAAVDARRDEEPTPPSVADEAAPPGPDEAKLPHAEGEDIYEQEQMEGKVHKT